MAPNPKAKGGKQAPIIIKKKKISGKHGPHHSAAWKIAYADFVTAMMAFFLLMWLINTMSNEQKHGISEYFDPIGKSESASGAGGVLGGRTIMSDGAMQDATATPQAGPPLGLPAPDDITQEEEEKEFEEIIETIQSQLQQSPKFQDLTENLSMEITDEGLQIQLIDQHKKPMFASASSVLYTDALNLLTVVGQSIQSVPNKVTFTGHTDAFRYSKRNGYSNWELSADRANAARRTVEKIIGETRIFGVTGKGATEPKLPEKPNDPVNRRISLVLVRRANPSQAQDKGQRDKREGRGAKTSRKDTVLQPQTIKPLIPETGKEGKN